MSLPCFYAPHIILTIQNNVPLLSSYMLVLTYKLWYHTAYNSLSFTPHVHSNMLTLAAPKILAVAAVNLTFGMAPLEGLQYIVGCYQSY